jgi:hypothetical protein
MLKGGCPSDPMSSSWACALLAQQAYLLSTSYLPTCLPIARFTALCGHLSILLRIRRRKHLARPILCYSLLAPVLAHLNRTSCFLLPQPHLSCAHPCRSLPRRRVRHLPLLVLVVLSRTSSWSRTSKGHHERDPCWWFSCAAARRWLKVLNLILDNWWNLGTNYCAKCVDMKW